MPKGSNGFKQDPERARAAGRKSCKKVPPEVKEARLVHSIKFEEIVYKYMNCTAEELQVKARDKATPAIDLVVIKILSNAITKGDLPSLNLLLERTIGKVTDKLDLRAAVVTGSLHERIMQEIENADK